MSSTFLKLICGQNKPCSGVRGLAAQSGLLLHDSFDLLRDETAFLNSELVFGVDFSRLDSVEHDVSDALEGLELIRTDSLDVGSTLR